ncbi:MAG: hypothetical protein Q4C44_01800 [bacterium]|nr:hypothetical protein [bacterium]
MEENNEKILKKVFLIGVIVILLIILLYLIDNTLSVNRYSYELPKTTSAVQDKSIRIIDDNLKKEYNAKLNDNLFLTALYNALGSNLSVSDVNLLQSEASKFIFVYTKEMYDTPTETMDSAAINLAIGNIFGVSIDYESIKDYKIDDNYKYEINFANPRYCLKASKLKEENDKLDVYLDLIDYNSLSCGSDELSYSDDIVAMKAVLSVDKSNNIYFINSFMRID